MDCDITTCTAAAVDDVTSVVLVYDHDEIEFEFDDPVHLCAQHRAGQEAMHDLSLSVLKAVRETGHVHARFPQAMRVHYACGESAGYALGAEGQA